MPVLTWNGYNHPQEKKKDGSWYISQSSQRGKTLTTHIKTYKKVLTSSTQHTLCRQHRDKWFKNRAILVLFGPSKVCMVVVKCTHAIFLPTKDQEFAVEKQIIFWVKLGNLFRDPPTWTLTDQRQYTSLPCTFDVRRLQTLPRPLSLQQRNQSRNQRRLPLVVTASDIPHDSQKSSLKQKCRKYRGRSWCQERPTHHTWKQEHS